MELEVFLKLFDSCWSDLNILHKNSTLSSTPTSSAENLDFERITEESSEPKLTRIRTSHTRSMSDQSMANFIDSFSPDSVLLRPKLQTIFSGKEVTTDSEPQNQNPPEMNLHQEVLLPKKKNKGNNGEKKRESKSLSDLEFEELKGFMDLGFVFSEEDKDSSLASIIPGLQRLGKKKKEEEDDSNDDSVVRRPYLSEAWEVHERRRKQNPLMNWKFPAINNETDMKDSLRWWAHTVASTVR